MTKHCSRCGHDSTDDALFCPRCGNSLKSANADPLIGTVVADRYILLEKIGEGRSGIIYRGEHNSLRKKVAVKILHQQLSQDESAIERFRREATTVCEIDNDHILQVLDFGRAADGRLFFAMELLDGETLAKVLERDGKLPIERVIDVLVQTGEALMEAHALGYIHRDLRPRNLFLTTKRGRTDFIKLLDFGLAKLIVPEQETAATAIGMAFGDPRYISPEQSTGQPVDRRADLYSLGAIGYEMLTGVPPYTGARIADVLEQHLSAPIPSVRERRSDCPEWLDMVIRRALAKSPERRFATVLRMHECLKTAKAPSDVDPKDLDQPDPRHRFAVAGALDATVVVAAAASPATPSAPAPDAALLAAEVVAPAVDAPAVHAPFPAVAPAEIEALAPTVVERADEAPVAASVAPAKVDAPAPTVTERAAEAGAVASAPPAKVDDKKTLLDFSVATGRDLSKTIVPGGAPPEAAIIRDAARTIAPGGAPPPPSEHPASVVLASAGTAETLKIEIKPIVSSPVKSNGASSTSSAKAFDAAQSEAGRKSKKQLKAERRADEQKRRSKERPAVAPGGGAKENAKSPEAKVGWLPSERTVESSKPTQLMPVQAEKPGRDDAPAPVEKVSAKAVAGGAVGASLPARNEHPAVAGTEVAPKSEPLSEAKVESRPTAPDSRTRPDRSAQKSAIKEDHSDGKTPDVSKRARSRTPTPNTIAAVGKRGPLASGLGDTGEHEKTWFDGDAPLHDEFDAHEPKKNIGLIAGVAVAGLALVAAIILALLGRSTTKAEGPHRSYDEPAVSAALEGQQPGNAATPAQAPPASPTVAAPAVAIEPPPVDSKAIEEKRLADVKRAAEEQAVADQRLAAATRAADDKRLADEKLTAVERGAEDQRLTVEKAKADRRAAVEKAAEDKRVAAEESKRAAAEQAKQIVEEKRLSALKRAADRKAAEDEAANAKRAAAEKHAAERQAANEKAANDKLLAAQRRATDRKAAEEKAAEEKRLAAEKRRGHASASPSGPAKKSPEGFRDPFSAKAGGQADDYIRLGRQKLNAGDVTGAMSQFSKAREIDGNNAEAISGVGECEFEQGDYTGAAVHLKQATRISPRKAHIAVLLGQAYFKLGRMRDAVSEYHRALKLDPRNQEAAQSLEVAERKLSGN